MRSRKEWALRNGYKICEYCGGYFRSNHFLKKFCTSNLKDKNSCAALFKVEYHKTYWPRYRKDNKKRIAERNKEWYLKNWERIRRNHSTWYRNKYKTDEKFKEKILRKGEERRKNNPEYFKQYGIKWRREQKRKSVIL